MNKTSEINQINEKNCSRLWDIFEKLIIMLSILGLLFLNYKVINDNSFVSSIGGANNFNIISILSDATVPIFIFLILGLVYLFKNKITSSKYNNTKLEIFLNKLFSSISILKVNSILYTLLLSCLYAFFMYIIIDFTITIAISTQLTAEVDHLTLEYLPHAGYSDKTYLISFIILMFSFFMITEPSKKINGDILSGVYLAPLVAVVLFGIPDNYLEEILGETNKMNVFNEILNLYNIFNVLIIVFSILMVGVFFYELFKLNNLKKSIKKVALILSGYLLGRMLTLCAVAIIMSSQNFEYFNTDLNARQVDINGVTYNYNTAIIINAPEYKDDPETEYLIESYAGNSMHNTTYLFEDLFSKGFEGDVERSYQLFATIYKKNNEVLSNKLEKIYEVLRNRANSSDAIALLIPAIIYEAGPKETTQNFINSILEKNYQEAIDSYINDSLNNNTEYPSSFNRGEYDKIDGYGGDQNISALILSIVSHGYATFDTDKITSEKRKKTWEKSLENNNNVSSGVSPEKAEEWFKIFDIK